MSFGYRIFVVGDDNSIVQISQRSFNDFYIRQKPSLPRFSGRVINVATVIYTLENKKPKQIFRIEYVRVKVDTDGARDREEVDDSIRLLGHRIEKVLGGKPAPSNSSEQVVNAIEKFDERRWSQLHPKLPGPAHKRILETIFG